MKKYLVVFVTIASVLASCNSKKDNLDIDPIGKQALMWFDATANFERFSHKDSIDFYLQKIKDLGFTHAVVDIRPISGEVLYDSKIAPKMTEWDGAKGADFDFLGYFIEKSHSLGMEVHASLNVFSAGHNYINRGQIYDGHPEWASVVYTPTQGIIPITEDKGKDKYAAMVNPINKDFQRHILDVLKEVVTIYPALDGIILDRVRYDGINADFSETSKIEFEKYIGEEVKNFPQDIFEWKKLDNGEFDRVNGKHFLKWIEWRTKNIYDFMKLARDEVKQVNPEVSFGTYTGAWYPSYFEVGVNFASNTYDPSIDYDWATTDYKNYGYAEVLDLYTTGNYYTTITVDEVRANNPQVKNETDSRVHSGEWYCVEGSNHNLRKILGNNQFSGGILADQFYDNPSGLSRSIEMNIKESDGVMIFDIVHIIHKNMWKEVEEGMRNSNMIE
ncbi:alpha amylase family protein [Dysgonomonas massiliensis]|uniref:alpha amylase family protein n=1 Tax=Dysgonomonas massiliensis TaxID=2040292 RepID=UPI000C756DBC|nr:alpha amylase family protein [Dysgonomonas massiliensis]